MLPTEIESLQNVLKEVAQRIQGIESRLNKLEMGRGGSGCRHFHITKDSRGMFVGGSTGNPRQQTYYLHYCYDCKQEVYLNHEQYQQG